MAPALPRATLCEVMNAVFAAVITGSASDGVSSCATFIASPMDDEALSVSDALSPCGSTIDAEKLRVNSRPKMAIPRPAPSS